jgi:hypothetical protein
MSRSIASRWAALAAATVCAAVWTLYLLAFWPAFMTHDSLDQWGQITTGQLTGQHSPFHTMLNWLITRVWYSPAAIAIVQIGALAAMLGFTIRELQRWNVPLPMIAILTLLFAWSPPNGMMVVTLWKDIAYSITFLGLFTVTLHIARTRGAWLMTPAGMASLFATGALLSLLRHNGMFTMVLMVAGLFWWLPQQRRRVAVAAVAIAAAVALVRGPLETALGVRPMSRYYMLANQTHQIAGMLADGAELTPSQQALLTSVMPLEKWINTYDCFNVIPTFSAGNPNVVDSQVGAYLKAYRLLAVQHPLSLLKRQICMSSLVWDMKPLPGSMFFTFYPGIIEHWQAPKSAPKLPALGAPLIAMANWTLAPPRDILFWRPATYLYLTVLCIGVLAWRTKQRIVWLLLLPSLTQSVILVLLNVTQEFRYQYGVYLVGLVALVLPFARPAPAAPAGTEVTNEPGPVS